MDKNKMSYYKYLIALKPFRFLAFSGSFILFLITSTMSTNDLIHYDTQHLNLKVLFFFSLSVFGLVTSIISTAKSFNSITKADRTSLGRLESYENLDNLKPQPTENNFVYEIVSLHKAKNYNDISQLISYSKQLNEYIVSNESLEIELSDNKFKKVRGYIKENFDQMFPMLYINYKESLLRGSAFTNDKKLCLSNDIAPNIPVSCSKGFYFDTFLTNVTSTKLLKSNRTDQVITIGAEFPVYNNILSTIGLSMMSNEIGISTLAISKDNYLITNRQNRLAQSSGGFFVPTGSGSADFSDCKGRNFSETIIHAMNRELLEENLPQKEINDNYKNCKTKIIGYFRWIEKGGKPEFVGITKIDRAAVELKPNDDEVVEKTGYLTNNIDELLVNLKEILKKEVVSIPLKMEILFIEEYCKNNKEELAKFLFQ